MSHEVIMLYLPVPGRGPDPGHRNYRKPKRPHRTHNSAAAAIVLPENRCEDCAE